MQITIEIPEEIGQKLPKIWDNIPQKALESVLVEAYRQGSLTSAQIQSILNLSYRWETQAFLSQYQAYPNYTEEDLADDIETLNDLPNL